MAGRPNRGLDPTRTICPDCAGDILMSPIGVAAHRARHLDWEVAQVFTNGNSGSMNPPRVQAWRAYAIALETQASDFRGQIAHLEDERRRLLEDVATRDDYIVELEADLTHERSRIA